ncbi:hypothetical protein DSO57_1004563 [Entomophthora muscae]|uniref:Uncharacterized protein n=1 Tax=Entomophthora muscae TaxID=34485 RepID=A0ACC2RZ39_9FUNG|nr:hypothetical protein DSO57_1004563 [Entomophthora muscae]
MKVVSVLFGFVLAANRDTSSMDGNFLEQLDEPIEELMKFDQAAFEKLYRTPEGGALAQAMQIMKEAPARRLPTSRGIPHVSPEALIANLQNAFIAVCPDELFETGQCVCEGRYSPTHILRNETAESMAVVSVDKIAHQIIVSYRPTRTLQNQFSNLDFELVQYPDAPKGVLIHHGFKTYHFSIRHKVEEQVYALLKDPRFQTFDLQITGYSLGAGISIASVPSWIAFMRKHHLSNRLVIYSYAGPRVGNEAFAQYLANMNVPITRYTNREDLVSHVPIRSLGYVHVGVEYYERQVNKADPELILCSQAFDEDPSCGLNPNAVLSVLRHFLPFSKYIPLPPFC